MVNLAAGAVPELRNRLRQRRGDGGRGGLKGGTMLNAGWYYTVCLDEEVKHGVAKLVDDLSLELSTVKICTCSCK